MNTIYKYVFDTMDRFCLMLPEGAQILCVQTQYEKPCIWAVVDPNKQEKVRNFRVFGTGYPIDELSENLMYVGTYQLSGGSLDFHLFEVIDFQEMMQKMPYTLTASSSYIPPTSASLIPPQG